MQKVFFLVVILSFCLFACTKDKTPLPTDDCTKCTATVSFKADIQPILTNSCAQSGCHDFDNASGGLVLDSANAYAQLSQPGAGYVDTTDINNSLFYLTLLPTASKPMPEDQAALPQCDINRIKCWIEQGAHNN